MDGRRAAGTTFAGYELLDPLGRRIGRVSRAFVDGDGRLAHLEVALGFLGSRMVLVPVGGFETDGEGRTLSLRKAPGRRAVRGNGTKAREER